MKSVGMCVVPIALQIAMHLGMKSSGTLSICSPKKSFTCVDMMRIAMPFVKPTTTGRGM